MNGFIDEIIGSGNLYNKIVLREPFLCYPSLYSDGHFQPLPRDLKALRKQTKRKIEIPFDTSGKRCIVGYLNAGWSSLVARRDHNPKVTGSNPVPATK